MELSREPGPREEQETRRHGCLLGGQKITDMAQTVELTVADGRLGSMRQRPVPRQVFQMRPIDLACHGVRHRTPHLGTATGRQNGFSRADHQMVEPDDRL